MKCLLCKTSLFPEKRRSPEQCPGVLDHAKIGPEGTVTTATSLLTFSAYWTIFSLWSLQEDQESGNHWEGAWRGRVHWRSQISLKGKVEKWWWELLCKVLCSWGVDLGVEVCYVFLLSACAWKSNPSDPWSRMAFGYTASGGSIPCWPVNKPVREGFVFFTVICSEVSLWWKTLLKRVTAHVTWE